MELHKYFHALTLDQRAAYARRAGTSVDYIRIHLILPSGGSRKIPKKPLMGKLASESEGQVSYQEVLEHFYPQEDVAQEDAA